MVRKPPSREKEKSPSFFKIMIGEFKDTIRIPVAFTSRFQLQLNNEAILKNTTGRCQYVEVKKIQEDYFFQHGWARFIQKNSIEFGDLLIFKYFGDSRFTVMIYSPSGCEKDTNFTKKKNQQLSMKVEKRKNETQLSLMKSRKHLQCLDMSVSSDTEAISVYSDSEKENDAQIRKLQVSVGKVPPPTKTTRGRSSAKGKIGTTFLDTGKSKTDNISYRVALSATAVTKGFMNVPIWFVRSVIKLSGRVFLSKPANLDLRLRVSYRTWDVQLRYTEYGNAYICSGWATFVSENKFVEGDVCIFEAIKGKGPGVDLIVSRIDEQK